MLGHSATRTHGVLFDELQMLSQMHEAILSFHINRFVVMRYYKRPLSKQYKVENSLFYLCHNLNVSVLYYAKRFILSIINERLITFYVRVDASVYNFSTFKAYTLSYQMVVFYYHFKPYRL